MKKNRIDGRKWEYKGVQLFASLFNLIPLSKKNHAEAEVATTAAMSKGMDGAGIDIWFRPTLPEFITRIKCQFKKTLSKGKTVTTIDIQSLIDMKEQTPNDIQFLFTKVTERPKKNEKTLVEVVTMELETFNELMTYYEQHYRNRPNS